MNKTKYKTKWQMELDMFKGVKSTFVIEGNINDVYPVSRKTEDGEKIGLLPSLNKVISYYLNDERLSGIYDVLVCDPIHGFYDSTPENHMDDSQSDSDNNIKCLLQRYEKLNNKLSETVRQYNKYRGQEKPAKENIVLMSEIIKTALAIDVPDQETEGYKPLAIIMNSASRITSDSQNYLEEKNNVAYFNLLYASKNAKKVNGKKNCLFLLVDKLNDIPAWFYMNNSNVRVITIPNPDREERNMYVRYLFEKSGLPEQDLEKLIDKTDGMKNTELSELYLLFQKEDFKNIDEVISVYKYGIKEDKWLQIKDKINQDFKKKIGERVIGQDEVVDGTISVIKRAVMGFSGLQHSSDSKPRGILFFAGPTGTGKTELVKTITKLLFEDEKAMIRFDMSEYGAENADQKLFGAPPGYVGYSQGGQLTNAVKNNPFSVLLFDEIEKAHPSIMDKFLQILEDGRMTDGQGQTVYFSQTLIVFTSNIGISEINRDPNTGKLSRVLLVKPDEDYETIKKTVKDAYSKCEKFSPEFRNRIGYNFHVFNYIDKENTRKIIVSKLIDINKKVENSAGIRIESTEKVNELFAALCLAEDVRINGGRGIGNVVEKRYLNALTDWLFDHTDQYHKVIIDVNDNEELTFTGE